MRIPKEIPNESEKNVCLKTAWRLVRQYDN